MFVNICSLERFSGGKVYWDHYAGFLNLTRVFTMDPVYFSNRINKVKKGCLNFRPVLRKLNFFSFKLNPAGFLWLDGTYTTLLTPSKYYNG